MVYAHLFAFFNSVMWSLYASMDLPNKLLLFIISGMGHHRSFFLHQLLHQVCKREEAHGSPCPSIHSEHGLCDYDSNSTLYGANA